MKNAMFVLVGILIGWMTVATVFCARSAYDYEIKYAISLLEQIAHNTEK